MMEQIVFTEQQLLKNVREARIEGEKSGISSPFDVNVIIENKKNI